MKTMRIFVSSPGDVRDERRRAAVVIERVGRYFARQVRLIPVLWEDAPLRATGAFQEGIDEQARLDEIDVVIVSVQPVSGRSLGAGRPIRALRTVSVRNSRSDRPCARRV